MKRFVQSAKPFLENNFEKKDKELLRNTKNSVTELLENTETKTAGKPEYWRRRKPRSEEEDREPVEDMDLRIKTHNMEIYTHTRLLSFSLDV